MPYCHCDEISRVRGVAVDSSVAAVRAGPAGSASGPAVSATTRLAGAPRELGLNEGELVVTRAELEGLRDRLYVLACALEDLDRDLTEANDDPDDLRRALDWLRDAARQAV